MYKLIFMTQAQKDAKNLSSSGLKPKAMELLEVITSGKAGGLPMS